MVEYQSEAFVPPGPVSGLFSMATNFVNLAIPPSSIELLLTLIPDIIAGQFAFDLSNIQQIILQIGGLITCLVFGILILALFPVVGILFCCCRCCGNCGGHRKHKFDDDMNRNKRILELILLIAFIFILAGVATMACCNNYLLTGVMRGGPALSNSLGDVYTFINNTAEGLENITVVVLTEFNNTMDLIISDLDDIGSSIGSEFLVLLVQDAGLNNVITIVDNMQTEAVSIHEGLFVVDGNLTQMINYTVDVQAKVVVAQALFQDAIDACVDQPCRDTLNAIKPGLDGFGTTISNIDTSTFTPTELNDTIYQLNDILGTNFSAMITDNFDVIPETINNMSSDALDSIKDIVTGFDLGGMIQPFVDQIDSQVAMANQMISEMNIEDMISQYSTYAYTYGQYIWQSIAGLLALPGFILLLQGLGLLLGRTNKKDTLPEERGTASDVAGCCLITSAGCMFLIGWILMLLILLLFLLTTPVMITLCRLDFDYMMRLENSAAIQNLFSVASFIPGDLNITFTISGVLKECDKGAPILDAIGVGSFVDQYLNDYVTSFNLTGQLENLTQSVNLSSFTQLSVGVNSELSGISDIIQQFNINDIISQFGVIDSLFNGSYPSMLDLANQLQNISQNFPLSESASAAKLNDTVDQLRDPVYTLLISINDTKDDIVSVLGSINTDMNQVLSLVNDTKDAVIVLEQYIQTNGAYMFLQAAQGTTDNLLGRIHTFIDSILAAASDSLKCKPITDIYNAVVHVTVCEFIINPLNGFWFCLGLIFFSFLFSIILATRLVKYYRRMVYSLNSSKAKNTARGIQLTTMSNLPTESRPLYDSRIATIEEGINQTPTIQDEEIVDPDQINPSLTVESESPVKLNQSRSKTSENAAIKETPENLLQEKRSAASEISPKETIESQTEKKSDTSQKATEIVNAILNTDILQQEEEVVNPDQINPSVTVESESPVKLNQSRPVLEKEVYPDFHQQDLKVETEDTPENLDKELSSNSIKERPKDLPTIVQAEHHLHSHHHHHEEKMNNESPDIVDSDIPDMTPDRNVVSATDSTNGISPTNPSDMSIPKSPGERTEDTPENLDKELSSDSIKERPKDLPTIVQAEHHLHSHHHHHEEKMNNESPDIVDSDIPDMTPDRNVVSATDSTNGISPTNPSDMSIPKSPGESYSFYS